ncbi:retrotransposon protein, putative, ty1-copia subclass [Tanacetum coccineum]
MIGYSFYYPPENKVFVGRNAEFLKNSLIAQEASGSLEDLEIIQEEDTHPSIDTSLNHKEDDQENNEPQSDINPIRDLGEPANYKAALLDPESDKWLNAMNVEMQSMKDNKVWILVELPPNGKTVGSKWLFKKKTDMDGAVHTYKARLVAKGYTQTPGIDYEETFSPVADIRAIRILIAIAAYYDYEIWQMDVKTAFLNGYLNEEVYMEQPEGFVNPKYPNRVCKLKRSIYGLKQASRQWNKRFDDEIKKFGFSQNADEPCVYLKASGSNVTFLILYVDDILIMGNSIPMLQDVKSYLGKCFAMKDLGEAAYILGIKIYRDRSRRLIGLCQSAYIDKILKRFHMENSKRGSIPMQDKLRLSKSQGASTPAELKRMQNVPYASVVGSIMYVVRCTRPDVAFAQNITSRFQQNPGDLHWTTIKNILKYLRNTKDMFLVYGGDLKRELRVSCYTDAGYLTDADDLKSQTGYVFVLNGGAVDWKSAKQSIFATSSAEAEYIAAFDASKEAVWVRKFISGLGVVPTIEKPINMYCDNTGAIAIANESGITKGARHFRAKVHYLRRCRNRKTFDTGDSSLRRKYGWRKNAERNVNVEIFLKNQEFLAPKRTCHVNIVSLVGFCLEGRRRALVYEFMPNGSLEKFIYDRGSSSNSHLGWEKLHQIAIGIARGLEYLHRISDFGLAKLFPEKRSMISMTDMRGTPGYIAPELFSRSFGGVSHKSDVNSYGMMILEMVGGRKNVQVEVDHTSEIYFPHWIYKKIELHEEQLGLHGIVSEVESEMARKMIIVGLWCIQTNSLSRPTMTKVVEMLEGGLELLEMPPKPYMFSPSRSADSSIIE